MMFKTKSLIKLPDAPKPPTQKMMEEDLMVATNDDDLFILLSHNEENEFVSLRGSESGELNSGSLPLTDEVVFALATKLSRYYKELEEDANILKDKCANLKTLSNSLSESVDDVKKQALTAMSTS